MKNLLPLLLVLFSTSISFAQDDDTERQRKTSIFLEAYRPVFSNSIKYYDQNSLIYQSAEEYSRDFNFYAVGIGAELSLKNNIILRPRVGLSVIDLSNYSEEITMNFFEESTIQSAFVYEQSYINLFLGLSKRVQIKNEFSIDLGVDLALISYLGGTSEFYSNTVTRGEFTSTTRLQEWNIIDYGKAMSVGIGPIIKPTYTFKMGLSISCEIQYYFLRTTSDSQITENFRQSFIASQSGMESSEEIEQNTEVNIDFLNWSWSEFSPLIRIGYSF